jgi:hypothetical protein
MLAYRILRMDVEIGRRAPDACNSDDERLSNMDLDDFFEQFFRWG